VRSRTRPRCDTLAHAVDYYAALLGLSPADPARHPLAQYANNLVIATLAAGILFAAPLSTRFAAWRDRAMASSIGAFAITADGAWIVVVFVASAAMLAAGTYNPFIYFRF